MYMYTFKHMYTCMCTSMNSSLSDYFQQRKEKQHNKLKSIY